MHAAYKGKTDMCKLLLQHGADVNCNEHEHGYTALMFAGLSGMLTDQPSKDISLTRTQLIPAPVRSVVALLSAGKTDITWMMLDAGAETDVVNSVGRTAAQMAAFVGTSDCDTWSFTSESSVLRTHEDKEPHMFLPVRKKGPEVVLIEKCRGMKVTARIYRLSLTAVTVVVLIVNLRCADCICLVAPLYRISLMLPSLPQTDSNLCCLLLHVCVN